MLLATAFGAGSALVNARGSDLVASPRTLPSRAAAADAAGLTRMAMAYEWGQGVPQDGCTAARLYAQAVSQGSFWVVTYQQLAAVHTGAVGCAPIDVRLKQDQPDE